MKIGIIGNYGATNIGDDAILTAILKVVSKHKVTIFSSNPEAWKSTGGTRSAPIFPLGFRSIYKHGFKKSIKAIKAVDLVVLGGGGLFQDNYLYACFLWAWQIFWVKLFKKPLYIYATGVGPLNTWLGKKLCKWSYNQAQFITLRDEESAKWLKKIGVRKEVSITADPVFSQPRTEKHNKRTKNLFIISLRPWLNSTQNIIDSFTLFLSELKENRNAEFIFVCMQEISENDLQMILPVMKKVGGELAMVQQFSELMDIMADAEFAIGMRYHFMIAALLTQTPLLPVTYAPKTEALFAGSPMEPFILKLDQLSEKTLSNGLRELSVGYNNVMVYEKALAEKYVDLAKQNSELFDSFLKTFDPSKKE